MLVFCLYLLYCELYIYCVPKKLWKSGVWNDVSVPSVVALPDSEPALRRTIHCLQCGHILACHSTSSDQSSLFPVAFSEGSPIHTSSIFSLGTHSSILQAHIFSTNTNFLWALYPNHWTPFLMVLAVSFTICLHTSSATYKEYLTRIRNLSNN